MLRRCKGKKFGSEPVEVSLIDSLIPLVPLDKLASP